MTVFVKGNQIIHCPFRLLIKIRGQRWMAEQRRKCEGTHQTLVIWVNIIETKIDKSEMNSLCLYERNNVIWDDLGKIMRSPDLILRFQRSGYKLTYWFSFKKKKNCIHICYNFWSWAPNPILLTQILKLKLLIVLFYFTQY